MIDIMQRLQTTTTPGNNARGLSSTGYLKMQQSIDWLAVLQ